MSSELKHIKSLVKDSQPTSDHDVLNTVSAYFDGIHWSLLKEEWSRMDETEKLSFSKKLFQELTK